MVSLGICACNNQEEIVVALAETQSIESSVIDNVDDSDILAVVKKFSRTEQTRNVSYTTNEINDNEGNAAIYVVNFNEGQGFMLISVTKRYCPVLAYSDKGSFSFDAIGDGGLLDWKSETLSAIEQSKILPDDSIQKFRSQWHQYEQIASAKTSKKHKRSTSDSDIMRAQTILQDSVSVWNSKGYTVFNVGDDPNGLYNDESVEIVKGGIFPLYEDDWERLSIGVIRYIAKDEQVPNFIQSTWGQGNGYNQSYPIASYLGTTAPAGCGPVALGQIMRYYCFPQTYNWSDMPLSQATKTTSDFLLELAYAANANFNYYGNTVASFDDLLSVLKQYGYTQAIGRNHNLDETWSCLKQKMPVLMSGLPNDSNLGHAWLATGGKWRSEKMQTEIWSFRNRFEFDTFNIYNRTDISAIYIYMNWGKCGQNDGFYLDSQPYYSGTLYNRERKDIYNITPNI